MNKPLQNIEPNNLNQAKDSLSNISVEAPSLVMDNVFASLDEIQPTTTPRPKRNWIWILVPIIALIILLLTLRALLSTSKSAEQAPNKPEKVQIGDSLNNKIEASDPIIQKNKDNSESTAEDINNLPQQIVPSEQKHPGSSNNHVNVTSETNDLIDSTKTMQTIYSNYNADHKPQTINNENQQKDITNNTSENVDSSITSDNLEENTDANPFSLDPNKKRETRDIFK